METRSPNPPAAVWKRIAASILDFLTVFFVAGFIIATLTGNRTAGGFKLDGLPAFLLLLVLGAYFWIGRRYAGGTLWDRIFGIRRPQPY